MGKTKRIRKELDATDKKILEFIGWGDPISINQLSKICHMSKQAIEKRVYDLIFLNRVKEIRCGNCKYIRGDITGSIIKKKAVEILTKINKKGEISEQELNNILKQIKTETISCKDFGIFTKGNELVEQIKCILKYCLTPRYSLNNEGEEYINKWKIKNPTSS